MSAFDYFALFYQKEVIVDLDGDWFEGKKHLKLKTSCYVIYIYIFLLNVYVGVWKLGVENYSFYFEKLDNIIKILKKEITLWSFAIWKGNKLGFYDSLALYKPCCAGFLLYFFNWLVVG